MNYSQVAIVQAHTDTHTHTTGGPAEPTDADETTPACGWFDSSWELRRTKTDRPCPVPT